jgi:hypothetical protein
VLEDQRVPGSAGGRGQQHRLALERPGLEHVEEHLEQAGVGRAEDRGDRDDRVRPAHMLQCLGELAGREAGQQRVGHCVGERAQLDDLDLGAIERSRARVTEEVGQESGR